MNDGEYLEKLYPTAGQAWDAAWERLFDVRTKLFYDFVSDYDPAHRFAHLPTPEEIARRYPNPNGWASGMEDSAISGGVMLAAACDRYAATGEAWIQEAATSLFEGLRLCGSQSPVRGMVLRSVSPLDGRSYFIETSRDQLTHFTHGLWRFHRSPLCTQTQQCQIRELIIGLCIRLEANVVPANDYHFGREDGTPGLVDKMWEVAPHEAGRLPMIYAVAWDLTADQHWYELYRRYVREAAACAAKIELAGYDFCYPLFQHQISLEVLATLAAEDRELQRHWEQQMNRLAEHMPAYHRKFAAYRPVDVREVDMDFRTRPNRQPFADSGYGHVAVWPAAMMDREFRPLRELGESLLIGLLAPQGGLDDEQRELLGRSLTQVDYRLAFTYGMLYPQAAFWRYAAGLK